MNNDHHIAETAELMRELSPELASAFIAHPRLRVSIARQFTARFWPMSERGRLVSSVVTLSAKIEEAEQELAALIERRRAIAGLARITAEEEANV